ncbi:MAG: hypothetical protein M3146_04040 [Thermoproteota archaeon]|nr:hypothetical protein [Thermoproteota archaeon]
MKEIILRLSDNEYDDYILKGQSIYSKRMKRRITDEEYANGYSYLANILKHNLWVS